MCGLLHFITCFLFVEWNYIKYEKLNWNRTENSPEFAGCVKLILKFLAQFQGVEWTRNYTGVALKKKNHPIRILIHRIITEVDQILLYFCISSGFALRWVFNHFYTSHRFQVENISISALFQVYLFSNHFKRNLFLKQDWRLINEPIYGSVINRLNHINS